MSYFLMFILIVSIAISVQGAPVDQSLPFDQSTVTTELVSEVSIAIGIKGAPVDQSTVQVDQSTTTQLVSEDDLMFNKNMCGGDMAGGMIPPNCPSGSENANGEDPVAAFKPSSTYQFWPYGLVYYDFLAGAGN